jgi:excisionase family DNA binding protein
VPNLAVNRPTSSPRQQRESPHLPPVYPLKEAAQRLNISAALLRRLVETGAIGHVRLGMGTQRVRVAFTEEQLVAFLESRTVPPQPRPHGGTGAWGRGRQARRVAARTPADGTAAEVAQRLLKAAIASGAVTEWRQP